MSVRNYFPVCLDLFFMSSHRPFRLVGPGGCPMQTRDVDNFSSWVMLVSSWFGSLRVLPTQASLHALSKWVLTPLFTYSYFLFLGLEVIFIQLSEQNPIPSQKDICILRLLFGSLQYHIDDSISDPFAQRRIECQLLPMELIRKSSNICFVTNSDLPIICMHRQLEHCHVPKVWTADRFRVECRQVVTQKRNPNNIEQK